jgi:hypothetical protein
MFAALTRRGLLRPAPPGMPRCISLPQRQRKRSVPYPSKPGSRDGRPRDD